jgi:hypothetical protein
MHPSFRVHLLLEIYIFFNEQIKIMYVFSIIWIGHVLNYRNVLNGILVDNY